MTHESVAQPPMLQVFRHENILWVSSSVMQLHVTDDGEPLSLYKLCRKWVHNDPDLDGQTVPEVVR